MMHLPTLLLRVLTPKMIILMKVWTKIVLKMEELSKFLNSQISTKKIVLDFNRLLLNNPYQLLSMLVLLGNFILEEFCLHGHVENSWTTEFWLLVMMKKEIGLLRTLGENLGERRVISLLRKEINAESVMLLVSLKFVNI